MKISYRVDMFFGDYEHMYPRFRMKVIKYDIILIFENRRGRNLFLDYLAENAIHKNKLKNNSVCFKLGQVYFKKAKIQI